MGIMVVMVVDYDGSVELAKYVVEVIVVIIVVLWYVPAVA